MRPLARRVLLTGIGLGALGGVVAGYQTLDRVIVAVGQEVSADKPLLDLAERPTQSTQVFDRDGGLLYEFGAVRRETIRLEQVPGPVRDAFLAAEDRTFYTNPGVSARGLIRAMFVDVRTRDVQQGGSTITQQLVQQLLVGKDDTLARKAREIAIALVLTQQVDKDAIFERYLNEVPVGGELVGLGTAANTYFGVSVDRLTVAQGAAIAALINAPSTLDPYTNPEGLRGRQQLVLERMRQFGLLDEAAYATAQRENLTVLPRRTLLRYPYFSLYVKQALEERYGETVVQREGLRVQTTLEPALQDEAERLVAAEIAANGARWRVGNGAVVATRPLTGGIAAMVGGTDFARSQVNLATAPRQPGSTIKPFVYLGALEAGYTPDTLVLDVPEDFGGGYRPLNYGGARGSGYVPLKSALVGSLNVPAVRVMRAMGVDTSVDVMVRAGLPLDPDRQYTLPLALGAVDISPLGMAQGYTTLATGGRQQALSPFLKITDRQGRVLLDRTTTTPGEQVLDATATATLAAILSDTTLKRSLYAGDLLRDYTLTDRLAAAKTGTSSGPKDVWTIGFTPSLVVAAWAGNTSGADAAPDADGIRVAAPIWQKVMTFGLAGTSPEPLPPLVRTTPAADKRFIDRAPIRPADPTPTPEATPTPLTP